ncbi:MAG: alginate O-acetyltransferase AlgF [Alphaproteobacteria bacterium]
MYRICSFGLGALLALAVCFPAFAGDEGLYPDAPPPGSAFVRFLNADARAAAIDIKGKAYGNAQQGQLTRYIYVPAGETAVSFGGTTASKQMAEGQRYSVVLAKGKLAVLEEPAEKSPLKAEIVLINASSRPGVALKSADGAVSVIDPVAPGALGARAVNAVKVPFALYTEGKKIEDLTARDLERGGSYAVVVYDNAAGKATVSFNETQSK